MPERSNFQGNLHAVPSQAVCHACNMLQSLLQLSMQLRVLLVDWQPPGHLLKEADSAMVLHAARMYALVRSALLTPCPHWLQHP